MAQDTQFQDGKIYIVKFIEWHAYIGRVYHEGSFLRMTHPKCIRDWGTTQGLGELFGGPTSSTVLDLSGALNIPMTSTITLMEVDQTKWADKIAKSEEGGD